MANAVVEENEIFLNGVYYPVTRPVRSTLASIYPAKVVIGDTTKDSQSRTSVIAWSDWRGGIGISRMEGGGGANRAWYSTCQLRYKNHLVLPGLVTEADVPAHGLTEPKIGAINSYKGEIYAAWNGSVSEDAQIYKYNNTNDDWGNALDTTADRVTDSVIFTDTSVSPAVTYLIFAHYDSNASPGGYTHYNGTTWVTDATYGTKFLTVWDERLWGISHEGQLWYATTVGTETLDAKLPLPDGSISKLFVARNAMGIPIIYAATSEGLFAHNADNAMWEETQMKFPTHENNGRGSAVWRDSVYIPSGNAVFRYINGNNAAVISVVGPDRDDGLPSDKRGAITMLAGTHNELLAGIDATTAPLISSSTDVPYQSGDHHHSPVIPPDSGYSSIVGYNEMGWETKWLSGNSGKGMDSLHVSTSYDKYRAWWGHNNIVHFMDIPADIINPSEVIQFAYALQGIHETPWFNAGQSEVDKLALTLRIEAQDLSSTEKVKVEYAIDYKETYETAVGTLDSTTMYNQTVEGDGSSGTYVYTFKDTDDNPVGVKFRAIKFKLTLNRSTAETTNREKFETPDVVSLTLEFRKKITPKWGHTVDVDLTNTYKGNAPKDLRAALVTAIESETLVEFTFRDNAGGTRDYYVDVIGAQGIEYTGYDERGSTTIQVVEP